MLKGRPTVEKSACLPYVYPPHYMCQTCPILKFYAFWDHVLLAEKLANFEIKNPTDIAYKKASWVQRRLTWKKKGLISSHATFFFNYLVKLLPRPTDWF